MTAAADAIRDLVGPALSSSNLELWDVEVTRDTVRVLVDRPGGIDLDTLASAAGRVVSPLLDEHPELTPAGSFQLEVSSPGVERTLRRADHYARYVGSEVTVKTSVPVEGARRHHGVLLAAGEATISIAPKDGPAGAVVDLPLAGIERARTVLVWGPAPKPGKPKPGKLGPSGKPGASGQPGSKKAVKRPAATDPAQPDPREPGRGEAADPVASIEAKDVTS